MFILYMPDAILILAAIVPAIALLTAVYRQDRVEPEPPALLLRLVLMGIFSTAIAKLLERVGIAVLNGLCRENTLLYDVILYFGIVAFAEEGAKYAVLRRTTWTSPDFDCRFDGVVYATFVSLGFALWENLGYVLMNGLGVALLRAVTAIPGHACFGVFMGCWYGEAAAAARRGDAARSDRLRALSVVVPALLHGAYDFLAATTAYAASGYFLLFVVALFLITFRLIRRMAADDRYI